MALSFTLLAAGFRHHERKCATAAIAAHPHVQLFVVLLTNECNHTFRGLYRLDDFFETAYRIYGSGPERVSHKHVSSFCKYNMATKIFDPIHTRSFGATTDAMVLFYKKRQWYIRSHEDEETERSYQSPTYASELKASYNRHAA